MVNLAELKMEEVGAWVAEIERVLSDGRLPNGMHFPWDRGVEDVATRHEALTSILGPRFTHLTRLTALFLLPSGGFDPPCSPSPCAGITLPCIASPLTFPQPPLVS